MKPNLKAGERRRAAAQMHALAAVRRDIGSRDRASGRKYLREFHQAFPDYERTLTPEELHGRVAGSDIVLVGDYHSLAASQRFAASLIERLALARPIVLGVEAVLSRDQEIVEAWWRREISEEELRRRLRFDQDWGYDWAPFLQLLLAARDHGEGIYGLDCLPRDDFRRIRSRDRHAARKIREIRERNPQARILVLFGESHLAPQHLPARLREILPQQQILAILQNLDRLYWKAAGEEARAVAIDQEAVCVFNSSPLEKYESYRISMAKWEGDDQPDFEPAVYNVIQSLTRTLGFRLDSPPNCVQPKLFADLLPEVVTADENAPGCGLAPPTDPGTDECRIWADEIRAALDERGCIYVARTNTFFIREFHIAGVAGEAARFLHHACSATICADSSRDRKLEETLALFGSRLLCPNEVSRTRSFESRGEALYQEFLSGRLRKPALRRMFWAGV
jgi:hypothetical protein